LVFPQGVAGYFKEFFDYRAAKRNQALAASKE